MCSVQVDRGSIKTEITSPESLTTPSPVSEATGDAPSEASFIVPHKRRNSLNGRAQHSPPLVEIVHGDLSWSKRDDKEGKITLHDINFSVRKSELVALVLFLVTICLFSPSHTFACPAVRLVGWDLEKAHSWL